MKPTKSTVIQPREPRSIVRMKAALDPVEAAHRIFELEAKVERLQDTLNRVRAALESAYHPQLRPCDCGLHPADVFDQVVHASPTDEQRGAA